METVSSSSIPAFLTAEWRYLVMLNYEIDPLLLRPYIPLGTELDSWNSNNYISMVGFLFQKTKAFSVPLVFHQNFEEVNLRFYVRRKVQNEWRRAVVFIKEIVPSKIIATAARVLYNEQYIALPMSHEIETTNEGALHVNYSWKIKGDEHRIGVVTTGPPRNLVEGTAQEFITEHYWGYTKQKDGSTLEYQVGHPRWRVWDVQESFLRCDGRALYGKEFGEVLQHPPAFALLAEGSDVRVYKGSKL